MNWSAYILGLLEQNYSTEDIITLADNPYINEEYVQAVRLMVKKMYPYQLRRPHAITTSEVMKKIDAYTKEIGVKKFIREVKKTSSTVVGNKLGVTDMQIRNYIYRYTRVPKPIMNQARGKYHTYDARLIAEGKKEAPAKKVTLEEMKTLW